MKKIQRLGSPYGKCQDVRETTATSNFFYSEELCEQNMKSQEIEKECNCKSVQFYNSNDSFAESKDNCMKTIKNTSSFIRNVVCEKSLPHGGNP